MFFNFAKNLHLAGFLVSSIPMPDAGVLVASAAFDESPPSLFTSFGGCLDGWSLIWTTFISCLPYRHKSKSSILKSNCCRAWYALRYGWKRDGYEAVAEEGDPTCFNRPESSGGWNPRVVVAGGKQYRSAPPGGG